MANSKYEYVRKFETNNYILPEAWFVVRLDGQGFTKFTTAHGFQKPNDLRALNLMNECAKQILLKVADITVAYGQSDEYSKIVSVISSQFAAFYTFYWSTYFPDTKLLFPPAFDARAVVYPTDNHLRDYLSWRQADCHINNLYNTCFWELVKSGVSNKEAEKILCKTVSSEKNELLHSKFNINYNNIEEIFKKGTVMFHKTVYYNITTPEGESAKRVKKSVEILNCDIIRNKFWSENDFLLSE
ncbi:putative tRNA(His) guanylyltransferase [Smittium culicis]|uniref:tRNA(His) guanylyltransferase n=1 Tax=Smittium culicis TaxID=133412 RepID=A0A1R1YCV3_9FUNG|nr:putative tRNA(His) guanylyltransferase [Smittium culicis]